MPYSHSLSKSALAISLQRGLQQYRQHLPGLRPFDISRLFISDTDIDDLAYGAH
jgi:hypothetical protein